MDNNYEENLPAVNDLLASLPDLKTTECKTIGDITRLFNVGSVKEKSGAVSVVQVAYISQLYKQGFTPEQIADMTGIKYDVVCAKLNIVVNSVLGKVTKETQYILRLETDATIQELSDELLSRISNGNGNLVPADLVKLATQMEKMLKLRIALWGLKCDDKDVPLKNLPKAVEQPAGQTVAANQTNIYAHGDITVAAPNQKISKIELNNLADELTAI